MSITLVYENNDGDMVEAVDRLREDTLEVNLSAAEGTTADSTILIDDPEADFYIRGLKPLYIVENEAITDDWFGVIGIFYAWERVFRRGNARTEAGREIEIQVQDVNTLLTRRLQKGTDAVRPDETDVARMQWLVGTPEVVGGGGMTIEDTDFLFTDSPVNVGATDYSGQDSSGVISADVLQDSGKNSFLFPSPLADEPIRVGIWYGRTERTDYSSPHRISNVPTDINIDAASAAFTMTAEELIEGEWTFPPSIDSTLSRDPSRVFSGAYVNRDGGYAYTTRPATAEAFAPRDGLFQAELVKNQAQAERRAERYVRDLRNEDDAIQTAVIVPSALVNAFVQGQRVQWRSSFMPGYSADFVWLRVAKRTVRQLSSDSMLYELALDLRAEEPPDSASTGTGGAVCTGLTSGGLYYPLGGSGVIPNPSDGVVYYLRPGIGWPIEPAVGHVGSWHFPLYDSGGAGTIDYAGDCAENRVRLMVIGDGTMTINTSEFGGNDREMQALLYHHQYGAGEEGNPLSGVDVVDSETLFDCGVPAEITVSTHDGLNCTHWVDVRDYSNPPACGSKWGFTSMDWDPA